MTLSEVRWSKLRSKKVIWGRPGTFNPENRTVNNKPDKNCNIRNLEKIIFQNKCVSWSTGLDLRFRMLQFFVRFIVHCPVFQDGLYLVYNNSLCGKLCPGLIELCHVTWRWHLFKLSHDRTITWYPGQKFNWFHSYSSLTDGHRTRN